MLAVWGAAHRRAGAATGEDVGGVESRPVPRRLVGAEHWCNRRSDVAGSLFVS